MRANELRIWNYVRFYATESIITAINNNDEENSYVDVASYNDIPIEDLNPIPLTEEWLVKFGFIKIKYLNEYFVQEIGYKFNDMILRYGSFDGHRFYFDFANEKVINVKHVNQLQNLYFALTGEELTIK